MKRPISRARRGLIGLAGAFVIFVAGAASAEDAMSTQLVAARNVVDEFHASMLEMMKNAETLGFKGRYDTIEVAARKAFAFDVMARLVYGPGWADLTEDQRARWIDTFTRFHISSVADFTRGWNGQTYVDLGQERSSRGILVKTQLDYPGRAVDLYTDYLLRPSGSRWKIVDIHSPPTVSELRMRSAEYREILARDGYDGLIAAMESRIEQRAGRGRNQ